MFRNLEPRDINGYTSYSGIIDASYEDLCRVFGKPEVTEDRGAKSDAEWTLLINHEVVATIYNWVDGPNYCGPSGWPIEDITNWHIGGQGKGEVDLIHKEFDMAMEEMEGLE